jgi:hypothetical protein
MTDGLTRYPGSGQFTDPGGLFSVDVDADVIEFTQAGRAELAPLFARAGIRIDTIASWSGYLRAREAARPHFLAYLEAMVRAMNQRARPSAERRALMAALAGDDASVERALRQIETRKGLRVVRAGEGG